MNDYQTLEREINDGIRDIASAEAVAGDQVAWLVTRMAGHIVDKYHLKHADAATLAAQFVAGAIHRLRDPATYDLPKKAGAAPIPMKVLGQMLGQDDNFEQTALLIIERFDSMYETGKRNAEQRGLGIERQRGPQVGEGRPL